MITHIQKLNKTITLTLILTKKAYQSIVE